MPPLIGNDNISLSLEDIFQPNNAGMNSFDMILSSGVRCCLMFFGSTCTCVVLHVCRLHRPLVVVISRFERVILFSHYIRLLSLPCTKF